MSARLKLLLSWIARLCLIAAVFISGLVSGVYYHNELRVLTHYYLGLDTLETSSQPPSLAPESTSSDSLLHLSSLPSPLPLVFSRTLDENQIQKDLKHGAAVLPLGTTFGQPGNVVVTAHSSGSAAFGPYRSAFAKLAELKSGEEFTVTTPSAIYTYRVYGQEIVWPHQVDRLPQDDRSTVTLVTCWPLWTNFKRLLVHSELVKTEELSGV